MEDDPQAFRPSVRITVVYNNVPHRADLVTAWGFAAVIDIDGERTLFDTGGDGPTLLANLGRLGIDPGSIGAVVVSHAHRDHTGGLDAFLRRQPDVTVYLPRSFPPAFRAGVERRGARVVAVGRAERLFDHVYSTGEMGGAIREQALIADSRAGLLVITGCAHPGVVEIATAARSYLGRDIHLLMGGFHLAGQGESDIRRTVRALRTLGVRRVAPSHCTGAEAMSRFREAWGDDFVDDGCGAVIEIP